MLGAKQSATIFAVLGGVKRALALLDQSAYGMHILFAAKVSAAMKNLALLPTHTAYSLALSISVILNDCTSIDWLGNAVAFEAWPYIAHQARTYTMNPAGVLAATLEQAAPARTQHTLDSA
jgi:hypothetical protein